MMTNVQLTGVVSGVIITKMKADSVSFWLVWHDTLAFLVVFRLSSILGKISGQVLQNVPDIIKHMKNSRVLEHWISQTFEVGA